MVRILRFYHQSFFPYPCIVLISSMLYGEIGKSILVFTTNGKGLGKSKDLINPSIMDGWLDRSIAKIPYGYVRILLRAKLKYPK